jgi:molybdopterin molybdotransferase
VLLPAGTVLGIPELALLAGQGMTSVRVPRRPRAAILATGDELCRPDQEPGGCIVDTNSVAIALGVRRAGGIPRCSASPVTGRRTSSGSSAQRSTTTWF